MEPIKIKNEEIYLCKKCNYPLSYSSLEKQIFEMYGDIFLNKVLADKKIDLNIYKCILAVLPNGLSLEKMCYDINKNNNDILCKNCKNIVGFITKMPEDIIGTAMILGFFNKNEIEINKIGFKNIKKEIPVISQTQYTVLAKLKQLRYYVKQLTPLLKESMELINEETERNWNSESGRVFCSSLADSVTYIRKVTDSLKDSPSMKEEERKESALSGFSF